MVNGSWVCVWLLMLFNGGFDRGEVLPFTRVQVRSSIEKEGLEEGLEE